MFVESALRQYLLNYNEVAWQRKNFEKLQFGWTYVFNGMLLVRKDEYRVIGLKWVCVSVNSLFSFAAQNENPALTLRVVM